MTGTEEGTADVTTLVIGTTLLEPPLLVVICDVMREEERKLVGLELAPKASNCDFSSAPPSSIIIIHHGEPLFPSPLPVVFDMLGNMYPSRPKYTSYSPTLSISEQCCCTRTRR